MADANNLPDPLKLVPGRVPPSDLDAEGAILSACVMEPGDIDVCIGLGLEVKHFYAVGNRLIAESIFRVHGSTGMVVDLVALSSDLRHHGRLDQVGGTPYLALLANTQPAANEKHLAQHVRRIIDCWRARQAISIQQVSVARLYVPEGVPTQELLEQLEEGIWEVTHSARDSSYENAGQLATTSLTKLAELLRNGGGGLDLSTGFPALDEVTTGWHPGELTVVAARPGAGKTAWLCSSILKSTALPKDGSLPDAAYLHSLEMSKESIALRLVCTLAGVEFQRIRLNQLSASDWQKLFDGCAVLRKQPIYVDDKPAVTVAEIRSNVRKIKREIALGRIVAKRLLLVAVDYLQIMQGQGQSREGEISSLSRGLKNISKTESISLCALAQLNRSVEKRAGSGPDKQKRPELSDLRESGAIEQDADTVIFIFRPKYYDKEANDDAELIVAKNRNGPPTTVLLEFEGSTMSFRSKASGYEEFEEYGDKAPLTAPEEEHWYDK